MENSQEKFHYITQKVKWLFCDFHLDILPIFPILCSWWKDLKCFWRSEESQWIGPNFFSHLTSILLFYILTMGYKGLRAELFNLILVNLAQNVADRNNLANIRGNVVNKNHLLGIYYFYKIYKITVLYDSYRQSCFYLTGKIA